MNVRCFNYSDLSSCVTQQYFETAVSLGYSCLTSMLLRRNFLQNASYPFDWSRGIDEDKAGILGLEKKVELLCNDFNRWIDFQDLKCLDKLSNDLSTIHMNVRNLHTGLQYLHDFLKDKSIDEEYPSFYARYMRRKERLLKLLNSEQKICFVFYAGIKILDNEIIEKLYVKIKNNFPSSNFSLYIFQNNPDLPMEIIKEKHINSNCIKVEFNNYSYSEDIQNNFGLVDKRLAKIIYSYLALKKYSFTAKNLHLSKGAMENSGTIHNKPDYSGVLTYGPYISLPDGRYKITICYELSENYGAYVDVACDSGKKILTKQELDAKLEKKGFFIDLPEYTENFEIRSFCYLKENSYNNNHFILHEIKLEKQSSLETDK